jgi:hypothetical protein
MIGNLDEALRALITAALPELFSGPAAVTLTISGDLFEVDPNPADAMASEPRPEDRTDTLAFDPGIPAGPYSLTQSPYPGPRRVYLTTGDGDRISLRESEVVVDEANSRIFRLALRPGRDLSVVNGVVVLYGITAVFTKLKVVQTLTVHLESGEANKLNEAQALAVAVVELNRPHLIAAARAAFEDGDYTADIELKSLKLRNGGAPAATQRTLTLEAAIEMKARRALRDDEGKPITSIRSPGRPADPARPIDIDLALNA